MPDHPASLASRPLLFRLVPLLVAAGLLLGANGVAMTVIAVRGRLNGLSDTTIGLFGSAYYAGFILGVLVTPILIQRVGHIRVFSALAALSAIAVLLLLLTTPGLSWAGLRFVSGIAFCGTAMVLESWLNALSSMPSAAAFSASTASSTSAPSPAASSCSPPSAPAVSRFWWSSASSSAPR